MVLLGFLLKGIAVVLSAVINIAMFMMVARAILSWVSPDPNNALVQFLYGSTDPILQIVRRRVPPIGMFDVSIIVVLLLLYFLDAFLVGSLAHYAIVLGAS